MVADNQTTSPSQRLGGGQNVGTQRTPVGTTAIGAASPSAASRLDEGKNVGTQRVVGGGGSSRTALAAGAARRFGGGKNVGTQRGAGASPKQEGESEGLPKLGGVAWWLLLGLMILSDIGSVISNLLVTAGIGLAGAVVTAPIGIPLVVVGWIAGVLISFNAFMFSMGYYLFNEVPLMGVRKLATMGVSAIIELIPWVNILPMLTISFLIITITENVKRGHGILGGVVGKVAT